MAQAITGKRYAQAAFALALEKGELERWRADLSKTATITADTKLVSLLENPRLPFDVKKRLLKERLGKVTPLVLNLGFLLTRRGKLKIIDRVCWHYGRLVDGHHGIEHAELVTAFPLDDDEKESLAGRLGQMLGRRIIIDARIDPSVIGGFRARIGDTLVDGTVQNRLESLKSSLIGPGR